MSNRAKTVLLLIVETLILFIALATVVSLRSGSVPTWKYLIKHCSLFVYIFPFWILTYAMEGIYNLKTYNPANISISLIRGTGLSVIISVLIIYGLPVKLQAVTPKTNLILIALIALPVLFKWRRSFFKYFSQHQRLRGTLIIGSQANIDFVKREINDKPHLGYRILDTSIPEKISSEVQLVALERHMGKDKSLYMKAFSLLGSGIEVIDLAKFAENISGRIPLSAIDESWFVEYCGHQESRSYDLLKAVIDRLVVVLLLLIMAPLAAIIIPLLLIFHGRPIFFKQTRTGLNNQFFTLYKLRTMTVDAEKNGAQWAKPNDSRITTIGKFLRKTRIDEFPQIINIFKGEMSLVGPRPEQPSIIQDHLSNSIPFYNLRHLVKPGVTGWAQVTFRYGFTQEDAIEKLQFDLYYVKNRSLWLDILIIIKTIRTVITAAGQ